MHHRVAVFVFGVCALALASAVGVFALTPSGDPWGIGTAVCFAGLGFFARALGHKIGKGTQGDISFIPFLTVALLAPNLTSVVTVAVAVAIAEVSAKRAWLKGLFNVAQYTLAVSVAIVVYRIVGGVSFLVNPRAFTNFAEHPLTLFLPTGALVVVFLLVNSSAVSAVLSVSDGRSFWETWKANTLNTAVYDILSLPFVLMFVGVYSAWGATGAVLLAAPLLAVRQLYKTNWQLQRTNQELLQLMVAAIEARDPYTSGHSKRVAHNARVIGSAMGLVGRELDRVATAALLHDVGKIHEVFAPILQKPSKLTAEERAIMETHSRKSAELIANVSHLHDLVKPVLHHHENWDGTGYPAGLRGEDIPLASRIIMIADTIDAMTTDRPYRKALGEAEVRRELVKFKGLQFDPAICDKIIASPLFSELFVADPQPIRITPVSASVIRRWRLGKVSA